MGRFRFHVRGIEAGIVTTLDAAVGKDKATGGYVKTIVPYKGQLNREGLRATVKSALATLVKGAPLILVCYTEGLDVPVAESGELMDEPLDFRHDCGFVCVVIDTDARGERAQREGTELHPGVYQMLDDVREELSGVQFTTPDPAGGADLVLNDGPLVPAGVERIDGVDNASAYAQHFTTSFFFTTRDRRVQPVPIEEIVFDLDPLNSPAGPAAGSPGVHFIDSQT